MVEKIQLSVAACFQSLEDPQPESESLEALAGQETLRGRRGTGGTTEETAEAADVAAENIEAPSDAEEIAEAAAAQSQAGSAEPDASTEKSDEHGKK